MTTTTSPGYIRLRCASCGKVLGWRANQEMILDGFWSYVTTVMRKIRLSMNESRLKKYSTSSHKHVPTSSFGLSVLKLDFCQ